MAVVMGSEKPIFLAICAPRSQRRLISSRVCASRLVAAEDVEHACGVAAATGVFQQRGVVQIGFLLHRELQNVGELHTQQAGFDGVAHGLAFGQIQSVGERGNQVRHAELRRCKYGSRLGGEHGSESQV